VPQAPRRSLPGVLLMLRLAAALACYLLILYAWFGPFDDHPYFSLVGLSLVACLSIRGLYGLAERRVGPGVSPPVRRTPQHSLPGGRLTNCVAATVAATTVCCLVFYRLWFGPLTPLLKPLLDFIPKALLAAYLVSPFVGGLLVMAVWEWLADRRGRRGVPALPEAGPRWAERLESRPPSNSVRPDESGHTEALPASSRLSPPASG
jgi:hypothetical protein